MSQRLLYHYTKLESLKGIIGKDYLCFWATRYDMLNDPTELKFAEEKLIPMLKSKIALEKGIQTEEVESDDAFPYILSFSKARDKFLMWQLYKAEASLVVDYDKLKECEIVDIDGKMYSAFHVRDVKYTNNESMVFDYKEMKLECDEFDDELDTAYEQILPFMKHIDYKEEEEVRMVSSDYQTFQVSYDNSSEDNCKFTECEICENVKVKEIRNGDFVLYKEFHIPKEALCGIILHTYDEALFKKQKKHLEVILVSNGYDLSKIEITQTEASPFR